MALERCWHCKQMKPDVTLTATDDRLCHDCYEENERQLIEQRKRAADTAPSNAKTRTTRHTTNKKQARKTVNMTETSEVPDAAAGTIDAHFQVAADNGLSVGNQSVTTRSNQAVRTTDSTARRDDDAAEPSTSKEARQEDVATGRSPPVAHQPTTNHREDIAAAGKSPSVESQTTGPTTRLEDATVATFTDIPIEHQLASLRTTVHRQQTVIATLQTQLSFVLSFLGITEHDIEPISHEDNNNSGAPLSSGNHATDQLLWSTVAANTKTKKNPNNFQQSLIAAVYNDQTESKRRESSLIITGFSEDQRYSDTEQFQDLCRDEFNMQPTIVSMRRLGRVQPNKLRPLLVVTHSVDQAQQLIAAAKQLRQSTKQSVRDNVYISRNLTKAEAEAAYQSRVRRRQAAAAAAARTNHIPTLPQNRAGRNVVMSQSIHTTDIDTSLSLLTTASNPHVIISPPPISRLPQTSADLTLRSASHVEEQQTGRQVTRT